MIRLSRPAIPTILQEKGTEWQQNYLSAIGNKDQMAKEKAEKKYNHQEVKDALKSMHNDKCAFCESKITHIDFGDIEHFRPKSKFPEQCFNWENLLLSCRKCNSNKASKFPIEADGNTPSFIKPDEENPNDFFIFDFDKTTKTANVLARNGNSRAQTVIEELKLNARDLQKQRSQNIIKLAVVAEFAAQGNAKALELLEDSCQPDSEYSAWAIALKQHFGL